MAWRRQGIGGSDAAAICGLDPWKSALVIWLDKTGRRPVVEETEWQRWGHRLEGAIIDEFEDRTGLRVAWQQQRRTAAHCNWRRATIDGLVFDEPVGVMHPPSPGRALGLLEVKTASYRSPQKWVQDGKPILPLAVQIQVQHQLLVTELDHAWVAVLLDGQTLHLHELERDPGAIKALMSIEERFWTWVLEGTPPPVDEAETTTQALRAAYPESNGEAVELSQDEIVLLDRYRSLHSQQAELERQATLIRNQLMLTLKDASIGRWQGNDVVSWKAFKRSRFDVDAFRKGEPTLAHAYTVSAEHRRLIVKGLREPKEEEGG